MRPSWPSERYGWVTGVAARLKLGLDPVHHRAELLALALDLMVLLLRAHALEALLAGLVLRDPFAGEVARLDLAEDLAHRLTGRLADDALAAGQVAVLGGVRDRVAHPRDALL